MRHKQKKEVKEVKRKLMNSVITEAKKVDSFKMESEQNIEVFIFFFIWAVNERKRKELFEGDMVL